MTENELIAADFPTVKAIAATAGIDISTTRTAKPFGIIEVSSSRYYVSSWGALPVVVEVWYSTMKPKDNPSGRHILVYTAGDYSAMLFSISGEEVLCVAGSYLVAYR